MVDNINTHMSEEGDSDGEHEDINFEQIQYNRLIYEGLQNYQKGDLLSAIKNYEDSQIFVKTSRDSDKQTLIRINLGILYFQNCEFAKATDVMESTLENLKKETKKTDIKMSLLVKLYVNYFRRKKYYKRNNIKIGQSNNYLHRQDKQRKYLLEELMYIFFRFPSFKTMTDEIIEDFEQRFKGATLACFYSSMGLNRELTNSPESAYKYHKKALEEWKQCKEHGFVLLSLKHLIHLATLIKINQDELNEYTKLFTKLLETDQFKGIDPKVLFKNFENKLTCAKEITTCLKKLEDKPVEIKTRLSVDPNKEVNDPPGSMPLWKQAIRLRLLKSIRMSKKLMTQDETIKENKENMQMGILQMQKTVELLKIENVPIIEEKLKNLPYTKDAVNQLKAALNRMRKFYLNYCFGYALQKLASNKQKKSRISLFNKQKNLPSKLLPLAYRFIFNGDFLVKCNKDTNGRLKKFFKLLPDGYLRWATKETNISKSNKYDQYPVNEMKGIVFGKVTPTLRKNFNKSLESWLCFSLVLRNRTLDFYCKTKEINYWIMALGAEIKKKNPKAYVLTPGKYLWRRLAIIMIEMFLVPLDHKGKSVKYSFTKAILSYKRSSLFN